MATIFVIPGKRFESASIKESDGKTFQCPENTVLTGRYHSGDENGYTVYQYATLKAVDESGQPVSATIAVTDIVWSEEIKESDSNYTAPSGRVLVGRYHKGDENGVTKYATAIVRVNGLPVTTFSFETSPSVKESSGTWFTTDAERVLVGRVHTSDENGQTFYISARLKTEYDTPGSHIKNCFVVPGTKYESADLKQNSCDFICPTNAIITGRYRSGDENGVTRFQYAYLTVQDKNGATLLYATVTVEDIRWEIARETNGFDESDIFEAEGGRVLIGVKHFTDNGHEQTVYGTAIVKCNGHQVYASDYRVSPFMTNNAGWFKADDNQVLVGIHHYGNESGNTFFGLAKLFTSKQSKYTFPFDLIVALAENETNFPMNATDYITLSRFRQHRADDKDYGYNKSNNKFEQSNSQQPIFYDIPVEIINGYYCRYIHKRLFNLRPRDNEPFIQGGPTKMHFDSTARSNYFLQPFAHLVGDYRPTGRTPVYVNRLDYTDLETKKQYSLIDFWFFFGYNGSSGFAHEGDWEHVMIKLADEKIESAWLSQHTNFKEVSRSNLEIKKIGNRDVLTVYCDKGSHAFYESKQRLYMESENQGDSNVSKSALGSVLWKVNDCMVPLMEQPWVLFAGAWGEVGLYAESTGPLGPWFKRFDFWYTETPNLSGIVNNGDYMIVPDKIYISGPYKESSGHEFQGAENMVMIGRKHTGDENGDTYCLFATLKAVNSSGVSMMGTIEIVDQQWSDEYKESDHDYIAPDGYVILGRAHAKDSDENGKTKYKIGRIKYNGVLTTVVSAQSAAPYQEYYESAGVFFSTYPNLLYIGRRHIGDENGTTYNYQGVVKT